MKSRLIQMFCYSTLETIRVFIEKNYAAFNKRTGSHVKMGKNDIWIATTAMATDSKLLTSDKDFKHLDGEFFDVIIIK